MDERIPVVGVDYPRTHQQLVAWFCPEEDCLEYLARLRWPGGFVCPACGGDKSWRTARRGMWMCSGCGRQTSDARTPSTSTSPAGPYATTCPHHRPGTRIRPASATAPGTPGSPPRGRTTPPAADACAGSPPPPPESARPPTKSTGLTQIPNTPVQNIGRIGHSPWRITWWAVIHRRPPGTDHLLVTRPQMPGRTAAGRTAPSTGAVGAHRPRRPSPPSELAAPPRHSHAVVGPASRPGRGARRRSHAGRPRAVSYTHLTLPTILRV